MEKSEKMNKKIEGLRLEKMSKNLGLWLQEQETLQPALESSASYLNLLYFHKKKPFISSCYFHHFHSNPQPSRHLKLSSSSIPRSVSQLAIISIHQKHKPFKNKFRILQ
jgi:hypothetical protein